MVGTSQFFSWYFEGLGGIGGWVLFLVFYLAAAVWQVYDSEHRQLRAPGWRVGVILPGLLVLPTVLYRFAAPETQASMLRYKELFFYLGLLGGIAPLMVALGYWVTFRGITARPQLPGAVSGEPAARARPETPPQREQPAPIAVKPARPVANAWLVGKSTNQTYQLYKGDTRIGRSRASNDIAIPDPTISREHILIREEDGYFTLYDRGASAGTLLNGRRVRKPEMLTHGDIIVIGDTELQFTAP